MREMSASVEQLGENAMSTALNSQDALSEIGDGSSSLSDIEDKEAEQDELEGADSDNDEESDANDSEAETERLENSPHRQRKVKSVVLSSKAESQTYERSPSKLQNQFTADAEDDDDNDVNNLSDDEVSLDESIKSQGLEGVERDLTTATTSLEASSEGKGSITVLDATSKKRKRSQLTESGSVDMNDLEEPARKRTGSVVAVADDFAIDDTASVNGDPETSNPISGNMSDVESPDLPDDEEDENQEQIEEEFGADDETAGPSNARENSVPKSDKKRDWKKRGTSENGNENPVMEQCDDVNEALVADMPTKDAVEAEDLEDAIDVEGDEAEAAIRNEEEQERKRLAMDQLCDIERHFTSFRDRLYEERLAQLENEEATLREEKPTHVGYLKMLECIDARRDEKIRVEERLTALKLEAIQRSAVARRSQIMAQFYQEVREIRERKLEQLGKQWYDIQHERRRYGSNADDYGFKFPTRKSQQAMHQLAYNTEVSVLSGIAKYVGFPAAPPIKPVTLAEAEHDFEMMSRSQMKQHSQRVQPGLPLQEFAALRAVTSTSNFKPAEEQFIEQTPWANPQHPSHAHLLQRQSSTQQPVRTLSPFPANPSGQIRRHSNQDPNHTKEHIAGGPVSGIFQGNSVAQPRTNGSHVSGGRISPLNPFTNTSLAQKIVPSPLGSRATSLSPQQSRPPSSFLDQQQRHENSQEFVTSSAIGHFVGSRPSNLKEQSNDFAYTAPATAEREQNAPIAGRF